MKLKIITLVLISFLIFGCITSEENNFEEEQLKEEVKTEVQNDYALGVVSCANYLIPRVGGVKYSDEGEGKKLVEDYLACTSIGEKMFTNSTFISDTNFFTYKDNNFYKNHLKVMNDQIEDLNKEEYLEKLEETFLACQAITCIADPSECEYLTGLEDINTWGHHAFTYQELCWSNYYQVKDGNFELDDYDSMYQTLLEIKEFMDNFEPPEPFNPKYVLVD